MRDNIEEITGVCHIALTPFREDESVDPVGIRSIVRVCIDAHCAGIVPLAIMGESHKLLESERDVVLATYVRAAGNDLHVIAGVTSESTFQAIHRARRAESLGATAVMLAPPRDAPVGDTLLEHFADVAASVSVPVIVQDEPVTTNVKMPAQFFERLAQIPSVLGVKVEEAPSPPKISAIAVRAARLRLFGGLGGISLYEELKRGAVGIMTGFGFPEILSEICRLYLRGDHVGARTKFYQYLPIIRFEAQLGVGGVAIRKQLFAERGIIASAAARKPRAPLDGATIGELNELLDVLALRGTIA